MAHYQVVLFKHGRRDDGQGPFGLAAQLPFQPVLGVNVSETLNVVENEPGQRDEHEHDEGDGDEEDRRLLLDVKRVVLDVPRDVPVPKWTLLLEYILKR